MRSRAWGRPRRAPPASGPSTCASIRVRAPARSFRVRWRRGSRPAEGALGPGGEPRQLRAVDLALGIARPGRNADVPLRVLERGEAREGLPDPPGIRLPRPPRVA